MHFDTATTFVDIKEYPWRRLKTASSRRQIPLIGFSLWAAKRVASSPSRFVFPKYCNDQKCNSNSASAALNQWLKPRVPHSFVVNSFQHSLRDRLSAFECPADIIDSVGGWTTKGIGHKYGAGYDFEVKHRWVVAYAKNTIEQSSNRY